MKKASNLFLGAILATFFLLFGFSGSADASTATLVDPNDGRLYGRSVTAVVDIAVSHWLPEYLTYTNLEVNYLVPFKGRLLLDSLKTVNGINYGVYYAANIVGVK